MTFKGSIVVKRKTLLNMIQNQKSIFRAPSVSEKSKWHVWGRQISYETLLEDDLSKYDWDETISDVWNNINPRSFRDGVDWIFSELS